MKDANTPGMIESIHDKQEEAIATELRRMGFLTGCVTYHNTMPPELVRLLQTRFDATALYLRHRADRIAVHRTVPVQFEWEVKTHNHKTKHDMLIEALPVVHHLSVARNDVRCLYIYRDPHADIECGFWVDELPPVSCVHIPSRWSTSAISWYEEQFKNAFPTDTRIFPVDHMGGSGDPYLIVNEADVRRLPDWRDLVRQLVAKYRPTEK